MRGDTARGTHASGVRGLLICEIAEKGPDRSLVGATHGVPEAPTRNGRRTGLEFAKPALINGTIRVPEPCGNPPPRIVPTRCTHRLIEPVVIQCDEERVIRSSSTWGKQRLALLAGFFWLVLATLGIGAGTSAFATHGSGPSTDLAPATFKSDAVVSVPAKIARLFEQRSGSDPDGVATLDEAASLAGGATSETASSQDQGFWPGDRFRPSQPRAPPLT